MALLVNVLHNSKPNNYSQAQQYPEWEMVMHHELVALEQNNN